MFHSVLIRAWLKSTRPEPVTAAESARLSTALSPSFRYGGGEPETWTTIVVVGSVRPRIIFATTSTKDLNTGKEITTPAGRDI